MESNACCSSSQQPPRADSVRKNESQAHSFSVSYGMVIRPAAPTRHEEECPHRRGLACRFRSSGQSPPVPVARYGRRSRTSLSEYECDGCARPICNQHHHSQRKPLAKSRSEKRPTLNVQSARNSLSQWPTRATAGANPRKSPHNFAKCIFSSYIRDLLADRKGFKLPIGFSKYPFEMSVEFPLMCRKMAD